MEVQKQHNQRQSCVKSFIRTRSRKTVISWRLNREVAGQLSKDCRKKFENCKMHSIPEVSLRTSRILGQPIVQGQSTLPAIHLLFKVFQAATVAATSAILSPHGRDDRQEVFFRPTFFFNVTVSSKGSQSCVCTGKPCAE